MDLKRASHGVQMETEGQVRQGHMEQSNGMQLVRNAREAKQETMAAEPQSLATWLIALFRKWRGLHVLQGKQMQLVETLPLGGKTRLMLVNCEGERFLVGAGAESVEAIVRLNAEPMPKADLDETCQ